MILVHVLILFPKSEMTALKAEGLTTLWVSEPTDPKRPTFHIQPEDSPRFLSKVWPACHCHCMVGAGPGRLFSSFHLVLAGRKISGQKDTDSIKHGQAQGNAFCDKHITLPPRCSTLHGQPQFWQRTWKSFI